MADEKMSPDSPLAQRINWDAVETPPTVAEVEEEEESSLKQEEKPAEEKPSEETTYETTDDGKGGEQQSEPTEEVTEATPAETKVEEPTDTPESKQEVDVETLREELRQELAKEYEAKAPKFANETIQKLNELALAGVDVDSDDFWAWQSRDLDKYEVSNKEQALELMRLELQTENSDLPPAKINRLLKRKYPALFDDSIEPEDEEYKEALEDLEIDAIRSKRKLKEHKQSITLPKVDLEQQEQQKAQAEEAQKRFVMEAKKVVNNYKEEPYQLDENLEIKFQIKDEARKFAESAIVNNDTFFLDNYTTRDKNGQVTEIKFDRITRDMTRLAQFDDFIKAAYEQGVSVGKEQVVDSLENADESISDKKQEVQKSLEDQIAEQLRQQHRRR
jgi:hypothetical protein